MGLPEFKKRGKEAHKTPKKMFEAFAKAAKNLKPSVPEEDSEDLFAKIDQDSNGKIDEEEFFNAVGGCGSCEEEFGSDGMSVPEFKKRLAGKYKTPRKAFDAFDKKKKNDEISDEELSDGGKKLKPAVDEGDAAGVFEKLDKNGDEKVD